MINRAAMVLALAVVGIWPGSPAAAQEPHEGLGVWSNYARLYGADGDVFETNVSYQCSDADAPMEIDVVARQGSARANPGAPPKAKLPCDGQLHSIDLAAFADSGTFVAGEPVELEIVLRNGLHEMRVDNTQVVGEKDSTAGVRVGAEFGIERVAIGYADPRLDNDTSFTVTAFYSCPAGYPELGVVRALQDDGAVMGHGYYRLTCDGNKRAKQVELTVLDIESQSWAAGPVELINQLGVGDATEAPGLWQRFPELEMAAKAELPVFGRRISNLESDVCVELTDDKVEVRECSRGRAGQRWDVLTDGTILSQDGRCLDGSADGVAVAQCDGRDTQKWTLNPREQNFSIASGGRCLSPAGGKVVLVTCDGSREQGWWLD